MSNPTSNFSWQMPTSTDLVTDLPADFEVFGQAVDTTLADLKGGTTGQVLKKNSNTDMDFVWSADSAGMTNPMTTTGDTIYSSSGSTPARLGIGSSGQVLTVSGGVPTWATASAGGMTLLTSGTLSGTQVNLSSISGSYKDLRLVIRNCRPTNDNVTIGLRFNNSTTASSYFFVTGSGSDSGSGNRITIASDVDNGTSYGSIVVDLYDYANTVTHKLGQVSSFSTNATTPANTNYQLFLIGQTDTAAIAELNIFVANTTNFSSGNYYLYGVN